MKQTINSQSNWTFIPLILITSKTLFYQQDQKVLKKKIKYNKQYKRQIKKMSSSFWGDVLKFVIPAGIVIIGLTCLSLIAVGTYGNVRLVQSASTKDTKFNFMGDIVNVLFCACGSVFFLIVAFICFKRAFLRIRHSMQSQNDITPA